MTNTNKAFSSIILCFILILTLAPLSHGKYAMGNPGSEGVENMSIAAGKLFFDGLSSIFLSFGYLEDQKYDEANRNLKQKAAVAFGRSIELYAHIEKRLTGRKINLKKFNKCQISKFEMDLKQFNFALPKTDKELINISISVMSGFINYLKKDKFVMDSKKNLDLMRTTNKNIYDIMNLSISLSEIATAIE